MTHLPKDHITVVGASVSGLYTALLLARAGRPVTVYERRSSPALPPRTLIATSALLGYLDGVGTRSILNEVDRYELFANGQVGEIQLGTPDVIVDRALLVEELTEQVKAAGAAIRYGYRLVGMNTGREGIELDLDLGGGEIERVTGSVVVGSDGSSSGVAKAAGSSPQPTVPLLQAVIRAPRDLEPRTSRVWFVPDDTPYFYWLIPEAGGRSAVGVIGENTSGMRARFDRFLSGHGMEALEYQGARIPRYSRWTRVHKRFGRGDVYLVGDAAGQVKVSTVGGLVTGFRGAAAVADAILGRPSRRALWSLRRELDAHLVVRKIMHSFGEAEYIRLLTLLNGPAREALYRHTRDEAPSILWKLALGQPGLWPLSLRALRSSAPQATRSRGSIPQGPAAS